VVPASHVFNDDRISALDRVLESRVLAAGSIFSIRSPVDEGGKFAGFGGPQDIAAEHDAIAHAHGDISLFENLAWVRRVLSEEAGCEEEQGR
jgi:hypothetical protein